MAATIKQGTNKDFLCKLGLHKWGKWHRIAIAGSSVVDIEKKCHKCGQLKRKTIPKDFSFGYGEK